MTKKLLLMAALLPLAGCGDAIHQTRYIPRASQLTWDADCKQLPWREPALGENHYRYHADPQKPRAKEDKPYECGAHPMQYHYTGDGDGADRQGAATGAR